jgi:hypothetical protein
MPNPNLAYQLSSSSNYTPATGGSGPGAGLFPIHQILVTAGSAPILDYYDISGTRHTINLGTVSNPTILPIILFSTGPSLTPNRFWGFSQAGF